MYVPWLIFKTLIQLLIQSIRVCCSDAGYFPAASLAYFPALGSLGVRSPLMRKP